MRVVSTQRLPQRSSIWQLAMFKLIRVLFFCMLSMKKNSFGTAGFFDSGSNGASLSLKMSLLSKSSTLKVVFFSRA